MFKPKNGGCFPMLRSMKGFLYPTCRANVRVSGLHDVNSHAINPTNPAILVGGLEHVCFFPILLGIVMPTDFHIFQSG